MSEYDDALEALATVNRLVITPPEVGEWVLGDERHLGIVLQLLVELTHSLAMRIAAQEGRGETIADVLQLHLDSFNAALVAKEAAAGA